LQFPVREAVQEEIDARLETQSSAARKKLENGSKDSKEDPDIEEEKLLGEVKQGERDTSDK